MIHRLEDDLNHILRETRPEVWEALRGKKLFITGGTGFFGTWLITSFLYANQKLSLGAQATVLTRDPEGFRAKLPHLAPLFQEPAIRFIQGDIRTFEFPKDRFDHILHAATPASAKLVEEDPLLMFDTIVDGTRRTLEFARHCGARSFLLTSSGAVYGKQPSDLPLVPEDFTGAPDPLDRKSAYAQGKRAAEHLCELYRHQYGIESRIARCFAFVGPYLPLDTHFAAGNFIHNALKRAPIQIGGDGTPFRSYMYSSDLMIWLWTILILGKSGRTFNVGSDQALSISDLAHRIADPLKLEVRIAQKPTPGKAPDRYVPSIERARQELGLKLTIPLELALQKTMKWNQP